jgi:hypothetical protein
MTIGIREEGLPRHFASGQVEQAAFICDPHPWPSYRKHFVTCKPAQEDSKTPSKFGFYQDTVAWILKIATSLQQTGAAGWIICVWDYDQE